MVLFFTDQLLKMHLLCCLSPIVSREGPANSCSSSWFKLLEVRRYVEWSEAGNQKEYWGRKGKGGTDDAFSSHRSWVKQFLFSRLFGNGQSVFSLKVLSAAMDLKKSK